MRIPFDRIHFHPALSLGSTLLWGLLEFVALQRSRLVHAFSRFRRRAPQRGG
jgi:hypothetical protein